MEPPLEALCCPLPGGEGAVLADEDVIEAHVPEMGGLIGKQITAGAKPSSVAQAIPKLPSQGKAPAVLEAWEGNLQGRGPQRFRPSGLSSRAVIEGLLKGVVAKALKRAGEGFSGLAELEIGLEHA